MYFLVSWIRVTERFLQRGSSPPPPWRLLPESFKKSRWVSRLIVFAKFHFAIAFPTEDNSLWIHDFKRARNEAGMAKFLFGHQSNSSPIPFPVRRLERQVMAPAGT